MKVLFLLESSVGSDEQRYVKILCDNLPQYDVEPLVAFVSYGAPGDYAYQTMKGYVGKRLCYKAGEPNWASRVASFVKRHEIDYLVVSKSNFDIGDKVNSVAEVIEKTGVKLVFVGQDCSMNTQNSAAALAQYEPAWISTSGMVTNHFLKKYDPLIIYPAGIEPQSSGIEIRKHFGINPRAKVMGYIGQIDGLFLGEIMIEVAKRLNWFVLMVGIGDRVSNYSSISGPIRVVPFTPELRREWYEAMDVFCYPVKAAGFPTLPLEALLLRKPVAMTPVGDYPNLFPEGIAFHRASASEMMEAVEGAAQRDIHIAQDKIKREFTVEKMVTGFVTKLV